jgi:hypothetical protein
VVVNLRIAAVCAATLLCSTAGARGVSPYLPLGLSPEIERQIERAMILADKPILTRPIAAATVLDALPSVCAKDPALCEEIRRYLSGYMKTVGLSHASIGAAASSGDPAPLPNRRGMPSDSGYEVSASAYWQPSDYLLLSGGLLAYEGETVPVGSVFSIGIEPAQLDVGFRDHWFSPLTDSAMLLGVQAQTMPSITLSSYTPITRFGLRYEIFIAEMSESSSIAFAGGYTSGNPRLAGMHLSFEPLPGWAIGFNRIMQYGGGERADSFGDLLDAFFRPNEEDNTGTTDDFGNQAASITSRFLVPGDVPFAVYFELAGEDTSKNSNVRLGNAALSAGVHFPSLWRGIDLSVEISEWQNGWYVHHIYQDGLRHEGNAIGHWGGDLRVLNDGVGAQSLMARVGWQPSFGGAIEATYRTLANESYTAPDYERAHSLEVRYSRVWRDFRFGGELFFGSDVFGDSHARFGGFLRF